jgi:cytoskeletal protein RodZ
MGTIHAVHPSGGWPQQAEQQAEGKTGFGEWLRRVREARGLTLDDISRETKISLRNLEALEHGNLGTIPVFYQRAEVRAVAKAVGVDERLAVGRLDSAIAPALAPGKERATRAPLKLGRPIAAIALACGVLLATVGVGRAILDRRAAGATSVVRPAASVSVAPADRREPVAPASQRTSASDPPAVAATAPETVAATPPAESFSEILVNTEPLGAHVTVNGIGWGVSPVTIRHLPPGDKRIRATKEGFAAAEQTLTLDSGGRQALTLWLTAAN